MTDDRQLFIAALKDAVAAMGVRLDEQHCARMWRHFVLVVEANRRFNLTRITAPADAAIKHYADSLALLATPWVDRDRELTVLDIGTGAGFPAVPLAIACDRWRVQAIDGTGKKVHFVAEAAAALGIANLGAQHARAADLAGPAGQRFDLVLLRAVTQLAPGLAAAHRLVNAGGAVVFYKSGALGEAELAAGAEAARRSGLPGISIHTLQLPAPAGPLERRLIRYARSS